MSIVRYCKSCKYAHDGTYGSGTFCSRSCANRRTHSPETKSKISIALAGRRHGRSISPETREKIRKTQAVNYGKKPFIVKHVAIKATRAEINAYKLKHNLCEICGSKCKTGRSLAVDHDHKTLEFRGLLCAKCNMNYDWYLENRTGIERYTDKELL